MESPMSLFVSRDELQELTGFKKKSLQIKQLSNFGIPFEVNRLGSPVVLRSAIEDTLSGTKLPKKRSKSINLESLRKAKGGN